MLHTPFSRDEEVPFEPELIELPPLMRKFPKRFDDFIVLSRLLRIGLQLTRDTK